MKKHEILPLKSTTNGLLLASRVLRTSTAFLFGLFSVVDVVDFVVVMELSVVLVVALEEVLVVVEVRVVVVVVVLDVFVALRVVSKNDSSIK